MVSQDFVYIVLISLPFFGNKEPMYNFSLTFTPSDYCLYNKQNLLIASHHFPSEGRVVFKSTFVWWILSQVFNGLGKLLVNMT